jgi:hypothetical protein
MHWNLGFHPTSIPLTRFRPLFVCRFAEDEHGKHRHHTRR